MITYKVDDVAIYYSNCFCKKVKLLKETSPSNKSITPFSSWSKVVIIDPTCNPLLLFIGWYGTLHGWFNKIELVDGSSSNLPQQRLLNLKSKPHLPVLLLDTFSWN